MAVLCKNCNTQIDDGAQFCPNCGTAADNSQGTVLQQQPPPPQQPQQYPPQQQYQQPQQYPPQQYQPQPGYPQQGPPKKAKSKSKKLLIPIIAVAVIAIVAVVLVLFMGNKYEKMDFFEVGGDEVPSVMYVLGEKRKITSFEVSTSKKTEKVVVEYGVEEDQGAEMEEYAEALMEDYDFLSVNEYDFSESKGKNFQFAKESDEDEDYIVVVRIDYTTSGYTLTITRGKGSLTIHDEPANADPVEPAAPTPAPADGPTPAPADQPTPAPTEAPKAEVELIVPGILAGKDLADAQAKAPSGVTVAGPNVDGSFTYSMSKDLQQQLYEKAMTESEDVLLDIYYDVAGVENVKWNPDDFSVAYIVINDEFTSDKNVESSLTAIIAAGLKLPMVQVYMGKGMATEVMIGWGDDSMENIAGTANSPSFLYDWLE